MNMKKVLFLLVSILLSSGYLQAQDLLLSWEGDTLGSNVSVWDGPDAEEIVFQAVVHNNTESWMKIKVRRTQVEMVDSTSSYFCWGDCFDIDTEESPDSLLVPSGGISVDSAFSGHFMPNMKNGKSTVEYMFYNMDNEDQNVKILVNYWASPNSISDTHINKGKFSELYPNPASTNVSIDYGLDDQLNSAAVRIVDIYGNLVREQDINTAANKLTIDISSLERGVYFYTVLIDDNVYQTQKLFVR